MPLVVLSAEQMQDAIANEIRYAVPYSSTAKVGSLVNGLAYEYFRGNLVYNGEFENGLRDGYGTIYEGSREKILHMGWFRRGVFLGEMSS